jgi:hypothetical protein
VELLLALKPVSTVIPPPLHRNNLSYKFRIHLNVAVTIHYNIILKDYFIHLICR